MSKLLRPGATFRPHATSCMAVAVHTWLIALASKNEIPEDGFGCGVWAILARSGLPQIGIVHGSSREDKSIFLAATTGEAGTAIFSS